VDLPVPDDVADLYIHVLREMGERGVQKGQERAFSSGAGTSLDVDVLCRQAFTSNRGDESQKPGAVERIDRRFQTYLLWSGGAR
jgi:hypothetical protein